ncbi:MAG: hypothetical protein ABR568_22460, partial [Pyrinomonadaceae bacterium]
SLNRSEIGADIELAGPLPATTLLFSESPSRIVISFTESARNDIEEITQRENCPFTILGQVRGSRLRVKTSGATIIDSPIDLLENAWRTSLSKKL